MTPGKEKWARTSRNSGLFELAIDETSQFSQFVRIKVFHVEQFHHHRRCRPVENSINDVSQNSIANLVFRDARGKQVHVSLLFTLQILLADHGVERRDH